MQPTMGIFSCERARPVPWASWEAFFEAKNPPVQFTLTQIESEYPISSSESIANKDNAALDCPLA